jgi:Alpha/beta hydrolase domain
MRRHASGMPVTTRAGASSVTRRVTSVVACVLIASIGSSAVARADAVAPAVTSRVTGAPLLFGHTSFDLKSVDYEQSEFFLEGTAEAYSPTAPLTPDGKWAVEPTSPAPYVTRVVVNRPVDDRRFNGTVVVEWLNVSGGVDASPDWMNLHVELIRRGYAWVGVSAQTVGLDALKVPPRGDPARYATLTHPGDSYSYDMFSQAGKAVRADAKKVLGGLRPDRVIAIGESQSAGRLVTYIDAVHPLARVYDGFLVHSRSAGGSPLSQAPQATLATPRPTLVRDDLDVPVLVFQTETDVGGLVARQPDSRTFRLWEVAGAAHYDLYGLRQGAADTGGRRTVAEWFDSMLHPTAQPNPGFTCNAPVNSGPQTFVLRAAIAVLDRWVAGGKPPPVAPRFETTTEPVRYSLDANGIVLGGIRTPAVDAPVATLSGGGQAGGGFCFLFGTTTPFSPEQLTARYRTHSGFVSAWNRATRDAVAAGFIRPDDARHMRAVAARSAFME